MADPFSSTLRGNSDVSLPEDQILYVGYALYFAGILDDPFLEVRLAAQLSGEVPGT